MAVWPRFCGGCAVRPGVKDAIAVQATGCAEQHAVRCMAGEELAEVSCVYPVFFLLTPQAP